MTQCCVFCCKDNDIICPEEDIKNSGISIVNITIHHCFNDENTNFEKYPIKQTIFELFNNLNNFMGTLDPEKSYLIDGDDYSLIIKPLDAKIEQTTNIVDFSNCEKILKNKYPDQQFRFVQFNLENHNKNCLTIQIEYDVYN